MKATVFIDGAVGTTGLEIRERLARHDYFTVIALDDPRRKDADARRGALNAADFVILCLPDDAARDAVAMIENSTTRVIDASSGHRVAADWTYGFAELEDDRAQEIAVAARVSNPGCYPTGFLALVRPLVRSGIIPSEWPVCVNAVSGYSGGGRQMIAAFEDAAAPDHVRTAHRAYAMGLAHKHVAEMQQHGRLAHPPIFCPAVVDTYRGMTVEVPLALHAMPGSPPLSACVEVLHEAYRDSAIVRVATGGQDGPVGVEADAGSDRLTLHVFGNAQRGQARLVATLDNLGKGAAGAAVQNLNLMAGIDPTAGLSL